MTVDDLKEQGGYKVLGYASMPSAPAKPKKTISEKVGGGLDAVFGGKQIGDSLVKAGTNVKNLVTGGIPKFNAGLAENTVNVPALIGDYTKAGATLASPLIGGRVAAATGSAKTGTLSGAIQGAKVGAATGGVEGAIHGGANAVKNQEEAGEVLKGSLSGAVTGAVAGGTLGWAGGALSGTGKSIAQSKAQFADEFVSPKQTTKVKAQAISEGRMQEGGIFRSATITPSSRDTRVADAVRDVISPRNSLPKNIDAIRSKISMTNNGVKTYVSENKVPFNTNQLKSRLMAAKEDSQLVFASDATAEKTYDAVVKEFLKHVDKKDTSGLLQARQQFDKIPAIKKLLDSRAIGENVKKSIVLDVRRAANEYIADLLPEGNMYRELLRQESSMIEALGNIAEKGASSIGKNNLQLLTEKYPILKWIAGGIVGGGGVGVGSTIIGSSD